MLYPNNRIIYYDDAKYLFSDQSYDYYFRAKEKSDIIRCINNYDFQYISISYIKNRIIYTDGLIKAQKIVDKYISLL